MKQLLFFVTILISSFLHAQFDLSKDPSENDDHENRFGVTVGVTRYSTKTDFLFSKPGTGFTFGPVGTLAFSKYSELLIELNLTKHFVKFVGRENETADPEDIKFGLENFGVSVFYNHSYLIIDKFKFGINTGPSFALVHNYIIVDDSKFEYVLDPLYASPYDLEFDTRNEQISFNMFLALGLSVQYDFLMANLRYYHGITDPFRKAPVVSPVMEIKGKENYIAFTLTYFFF